MRGEPHDQALPDRSSLEASVAGTEVKHSFACHKQHLVQEYAELLGADIPTNAVQFDQMFDAAAQYVHLNLLQDLSPPWIEHEFSQALPGDGVLSRYLKPTFLCWDMNFAPQLFGKVLTDTWMSVAPSLALKAGGVVGRPLCVCTQRWRGEMCTGLQPCRR